MSLKSAPTKREKWSALKLEETRLQRARIMAYIRRNDERERFSLERAVMEQGGRMLPRPHLRDQIRRWYRLRWEYLMSEYEKALPHVDELPDEEVALAIRSYLATTDEL